MNKPVAAPAPAEGAELCAEEYEAASAKLRGALSRLYPLADEDFLDDVVQDAWTALYSHQRRTGERLEGNARADFLFVAARRRVVAQWRRSRCRKTNLSGQGVSLELTGEPASAEETPEEQVVEQSAEREVGRILAEELTDHQRAIFRLRYLENLEPREIRERLGVSERAIYKALKKGIDKLVVRLLGERHPLWETGQRALIVSVLAGTASERKLERARRLAAHDPAIARALEDAGTALHGAAAAIPAEAALRAQGQSLTERLSEAATNLTGRSDPVGEAEAIAAGVAQSGAGRGAGAAGAGLLAKLGALGGAGKTAVACLVTTGAAATCVATGVVPGVGLGGGEERGPGPAKVEEAKEAAPTPDGVLGQLDQGDAPGPSEGPAPAPDSPPPPSAPAPAPEPEVAETESGLTAPQTHSEQVQQEFDLAGAAQPVSGSGGGGSGGGSSEGSGGGGGAKDASGSQVAQEFGP